MDDFNTIFLIFVLASWALNNLFSCFVDLECAESRLAAAWEVIVGVATLYMFYSLTTWIWKLHPITF